MEIKSVIYDHRIEAANVLAEMTIGQYLDVAPYIIDNNEYQRKKVIKSKIKEILREDLLRGCSIPPIVLSINNNEFADNFNYKKFNDFSVITKAFDNNSILIIDGLQRTFVMLALKEELIVNKRAKELDSFLKQTIRAEIYVGLGRLGILYRMITLNTGQTTMSTRHLMEILYFDYQVKGMEGIVFVKDKDDEPIKNNTKEYKFKDALDGFNSYIEKSENLINRTEILDNIKTLDTLNKEDYKKDDFKNFIILYKELLDYFNTNSNKWKYSIDDFEGNEFAIKSSPFGSNAIEIFKRSQAFTGFGAALGKLKENKGISIEMVSKKIKKITATDNDFSYFFKLIIKHLDSIKEKSKKIGNDQRYYFRFLFEYLFDTDSDSHLKVDKAASNAFERTRVDRLQNSKD